MDTNAVRTFVSDHPDGVEIFMIDGTSYRVPHRDYVWFTPAYGKSESRVGRLATSFWLHDEKKDETRLVNAMMVKEIRPLHANGNGGSTGRSRKRKQ